MVGFIFFYSHFPTPRDYNDWTDPYPTPHIDSSSTAEESTYKHPIIVIHFDSESPENKRRHLKNKRHHFNGDNISNYHFTTIQRQLAMEAKVANNIEELEGWVCQFLLYLCPKLNFFMSLMKI